MVKFSLFNFLFIHLNVALEVEGIVKQLAAAGDHEKITALIKLFTDEFPYSPQANHRKGGLRRLGAATVGLTSEAAQHLEICGAKGEEKSIPWRDSDHSSGGGRRRAPPRIHSAKKQHAKNRALLRCFPTWRSKNWSKSSRNLT
ncbi:hypothetical protein Nepgr_029285 [Nepenthes gracilis]|uniref:Uncharacterized protein n=1 Tax=Nepenthes gracilis TaxID=150966 RepID=A0AAD3TDN7_NEPGR|nr:hypothetical protein Nepgr_029285 [Nepenthes gracilis]